MSTGSQFRFVDLFAGLGGFHVALERLGGEAVFAAEWEPELAKLYELNFGIKPFGDVSKIRDIDRTIPDHEVLTAGFPCQPFSKAGDQLGFEHSLQGQLFFMVRDILEVKKPDYFILENVPNLLRHRKGETLVTIFDALERIGYAVDVKEFSPHEFGIPQIRHRAYFVGRRNGLNGFEWPSATLGKQLDIASVLSPSNEVVRKIPETTLRAIDVWGDFLRSAPSNLKLPSFPIWAMEFGASYPFENETPAFHADRFGTGSLAEFKGNFGISIPNLPFEDQVRFLPSHSVRPGETFPTWKRTFIRQNRAFFEDNRAWLEPWMERSNLNELPSSLQKFEWNAQGEPRDINNFILQVRASGLRVKRRSYAPSLVAMTHTQVPIIAWERRYMTPRECARLQSLGDGLRLPENDLAAYKALGNAVNSDVVAAIASNLIDFKISKAA